MPLCVCVFALFDELAAVHLEQFKHNRSAHVVPSLFTAFLISVSICVGFLPLHFAPFYRIHLTYIHWRTYLIRWRAFLHRYAFQKNTQKVPFYVGTALSLYRIKRITWHESSICSANFKIDAVYLRFACNKPIGNKPDQIDGKIIYYRTNIYENWICFNSTQSTAFELWAAALQTKTETLILPKEKNKLTTLLCKVYKRRAFQLETWFRRSKID